MHVMGAVEADTSLQPMLPHRQTGRPPAALGSQRTTGPTDVKHGPRKTPFHEPSVVNGRDELASSPSHFNLEVFRRRPLIFLCLSLPQSPLGKLQFGSTVRKRELENFCHGAAAKLFCFWLLFSLLPQLPSKAFTSLRKPCLKYRRRRPTTSGAT